VFALAMQEIVETYTRDSICFQFPSESQCGKVTTFKIDLEVKTNDTKENLISFAAEEVKKKFIEYVTEHYDKLVVSDAELFSKTEA